MSGTSTPNQLAVSDVVQVNVVLQPVAAQLRSFGQLLILGSSPVINLAQRIRQYANISGVLQDFGSTAPEYQAAALFFSQSPQPAVLNIGRWAAAATPGELDGSVFNLQATNALLAALQAITTGSLKLTIDGTLQTLSGLNFSGILNLNGAAAVLTTALAGHGTVVWNSAYSQFIVTSSTTGTASSVSYASPTGAGTDVAVMLGLSVAPPAAATPVVGYAAETALAAVQAVAVSNGLYGLEIAAPGVSLAQHLAIAEFIEASGTSRVYGVTTQDPNTLLSSSTADLAYQLKQGGFTRSFVQYSSYSQHAVASLFGRAFTVDFTGNNTTITLKFKQEPGLQAENLTETQATVLNAKNCNVFVAYNNDTNIVQQGQMSSGIFFDERHGADWLQNWVQTAVYNLLYQSPTKIPQTDAGIHLIVTTIENALQQAVNNGFAAGGVWNGPSFGQIVQGQTLPKGYYVYAPPIASQSYTVRQTRAAPLIQCAVTEAGAVHSCNVLINVSR